MGICLRRVDKTKYKVLATPRFLLSRKVCQLSESVAFGQKLRYLKEQNRPKMGSHENEF